MRCITRIAPVNWRSANSASRSTIPEGDRGLPQCAVGLRFARTLSGRPVAMIVASFQIIVAAFRIETPRMCGCWNSRQAYNQGRRKQRNHARQSHHSALPVSRATPEWRGVSRSQGTVTLLDRHSHSNSWRPDKRTQTTLPNPASPAFGLSCQNFTRGNPDGSFTVMPLPPGLHQHWRLCLGKWTILTIGDRSASTS